jgi:1,4-alpha-glucan branching enzyme
MLRREPALHEFDSDPAGFEWVDCNDAPMSVISLLRKGKAPKDVMLAACNFTPVPREKYRVGVPFGGFWREVLNSDANYYAGSGVGNSGGVTAESIQQHGRPFSLELTLPPLAAVFLKPE